MKNITEFVELFNNMWVLIVVIVGLSIHMYNKITKYIKLSKEEKVEAALKIIKEELLKLMSDAEIEWQEFSKSGMIKKSQVITEIYNKFPFLVNYISQEELINKITEMINETKTEMDKIINNQETEDNK